MRIGMILSRPLPPREGIGLYAWNLACFLRDRGHEVHLITRGGLGSVPAQDVGGITIHRPVFVPLYPLHVHVHALFLSYYLKKLSGSLDLLHIHSPLVLPPKTDLPLLVTVHSPVKTSVPATGHFNPLELANKLQAPVSRGIERALFRRAGRIAAISAGVANQLDAYGLPREKITVTGNGVFTDFFVPAPSRMVMPEKPTFLTVGRLALGKGFEDFIRASQKVNFVYPNTRFLIIGGGPLEPDLRSEIDRHGLDGIVRLGGAITDRLTLSIFYQNAYAYVHPSHYDGLPTALLEAMSCGKAVVAADIPGNRNVIEAGENGLLVPAHRPDELAHAMLWLIEHPQLADSLGQAARRTVEQNYSWETVGERYLAEYQALLEQKQ